jgi:hypothetical protein
MSILVLTSDTLIGTPASGNLEYNGQFFGTDSNASRAQFQRIARATAVASTSGTSIDFTNIPAWVEKITVIFQGVSTNSTSNHLIQLGAGSVTSSGYTSLGLRLVNAASPSSASSTAGFILGDIASASAAIAGHMVITNISGNIWVASGYGSYGSGGFINGGSISLSGTLDRVRLTTVNGTDTFDAGSVNIIYEG